MTLTPGNMKVDPTGNKWDGNALSHDISIMDESQLERYIRLAFLEEVNPDFLPEHSEFWQHFSIYGGDEGPLTPGRFFAQEYSIINAFLAGEYHLTYEPDPQFRTRLEGVLKKILKECLDYERNTTENQKMLARFAVEAVGSIRFNDRFDMARIDELIDLSKRILTDSRYSGVVSEHGMEFYKNLIMNYTPHKNTTKQ